MACPYNLTYLSSVRLLCDRNISKLGHLSCLHIVLSKQFRQDSHRRWALVALPPRFGLDIARLGSDLGHNAQLKTMVMAKILNRDTKVGQSSK